MHQRPVAALALQEMVALVVLAQVTDWLAAEVVQETALVVSSVVLAAQAVLVL